MTNHEIQNVIRQYVRGVYETQKHRIAMGNQVVATFKAREGIKPGMREEDADKETQNLLKDLRTGYKLIAEGVTNLNKRSFKGNDLISTWAELVLVEGYVQMLEAEELQFKRLESVLNDHPLYPWLKSINGIGPAMAGVIISEFDIHKAKYPSSLWKYAGLDVTKDGRGRAKKKDMMETVTYIDKDGIERERLSLGYNPTIKTKLIGVLGGSFLKQKPEKCKYRVIYDNYKHRKETDPVFQKKQERLAEEAAAKGQKYAPVGHRHAMSIRYMIKMFLVDLYNEWRAIEGLPVAPTYTEWKHGNIHGSDQKDWKGGLGSGGIKNV